VEGLAAGHVVNAVMEGLDAGWREGFGNVSDAAPDDSFGGLGMGLAEGVYAAGNLWEEIAGPEFEVVVVEEGHWM